jgi:hypothetical protein
MGMRVAPVSVAIVSLSAMVMLGCGAGGSNSFDDSNGPPSSTGPGGSAGGSGEPDATLPGSGGDTDAQLFGPSALDDAGVVVQSGACAAGVYQGPFMTYVGVGGEGGAPSPFGFMWNGSLTIDLSAQKITMTSTTVGELPTTTLSSTLEIADGGALDGGDTMGGTFFANLSGTLDCAPDAGPPYHFTATLHDGLYKLPYYQVAMIGDLTADYQEAGVSAAPMLVNGHILVGGVYTDGGPAFASASGTWTATWISKP